MEKSTGQMVTFLGCPVSAQTSRMLQSWRRTVAPHFALPSGEPILRWTRPESLHITLHYFGPTAQGVVDDHQTALGALVQAIPAIPIRLHTLALFPKPETARGLWVEVEDPTGALKQLYEDLAHKLQQLDLPVAGRIFRPHITLGRVSSRLKGAQRREAAVVMRRVLAARHLSFSKDTVSQVHWYRSQQQPGGNFYLPLTSWRLRTT